ncbi:helix-turn-helix domain-containing protein [Actinoalloteichus hymeniacidonis]|nr:helix-turn-helix transcriptional regulator [Actinoalloteichus hymeniacidonis]
MELGPLLRAARARAGITQEELEARSGISVRTIRRVETGRTRSARPETIRLLAVALNTTPEEHRALLSAATELPDVPTADGQPWTAPYEPSASTRSEAGDRAAPRSALQQTLDDAADRLRLLVRSRWQREEERHRIHNPTPLPVRWRPLPTDFTGRRAAGGPDDPVGEALGDLAGELSDIVDTYRRIPSGRLVVLGGAGAGKTILTIRFVLDYLRAPATDDPVPVIFSLGSWNPQRITLREWMVECLLHDDPGLIADSGAGTSLAAALVEADRILPVLDGFDEIHERLRVPAMQELSFARLPMLLTSRRDEYVAAVTKADHELLHAAAIHLEDLSPDDLIDHLPNDRHTTKADSPWGRLLAELRENPERPENAALASALRTPLMVALASAIYSGDPGKDPAALLDADRFPSAESIEEHLVTGFIPNAYRARPGNSRPSWTPDRVQRWFGHLANHLDRLGTPNLAWWQFPKALSPAVRVLGVIVATMILSGTMDFLITAFIGVNALGLGDMLLLALFDGVTVGLVVGLGFGLVYAAVTMVLRIEVTPSRVRLGMSGRSWAGLMRAAPDIAIRVGGGMIIGFLIGVGYGWALLLVRNVLSDGTSALATLMQTTVVLPTHLGLTFSLAGGVVLGLVLAMERPVDLSVATKARAMLVANREAVQNRILVLVPLLTVSLNAMAPLTITFFPGYSWNVAAGFGMGVVGGLVGASCYAATFTAWGQWLILARVWLPLTGRLPWSIIAFLEDAHRRGVLRHTGSVYQFRHARLQAYCLREHARRTLLGATESASRSIARS